MVFFWISISAQATDQTGTSLIWSEPFSNDVFPSRASVKSKLTRWKAPARDAFRWTTKVFDINPDITESSAWLYCGPPDGELDLRWSRLLNCKLHLNEFCYLRAGSGALSELTGC